MYIPPRVSSLLFAASSPHSRHSLFLLSIPLFSSFSLKVRKDAAFHRNREETPEHRRFAGTLASGGSASYAVCAGDSLEKKRSGCSRVGSARVAGVAEHR